MLKIIILINILLCFSIYNCSCSTKNQTLPEESITAEIEYREQ